MPTYDCDYNEVVCIAKYSAPNLFQKSQFEQRFWKSKFDKNRGTKFEVLTSKFRGTYNSALAKISIIDLGNFNK